MTFLSHFFNIRVEGSIPEGTFTVRNAATDRALLRVREEELLRPNFFSEELPFMCSQTQSDPGLSDSSPSLELVEQSFEFRLPVELDGKLMTVLVRKDKGEWQGRA